MELEAQGPVLVLQSHCSPVEKDDIQISWFPLSFILSLSVFLSVCLSLSLSLPLFFLILLFMIQTHMGLFMNISDILRTQKNLVSSRPEIMRSFGAVQGIFFFQQIKSICYIWPLYGYDFFHSQLSGGGFYGVCSCANFLFVIVLA